MLRFKILLSFFIAKSWRRKVYVKSTSWREKSWYLNDNMIWYTIQQDKNNNNTEKWQLNIYETISVRHDDMRGTGSWYMLEILLQLEDKQKKIWLDYNNPSFLAIRLVFKTRGLTITLLGNVLSPHSDHSLIH